MQGISTYQWSGQWQMQLTKRIETVPTLHQLQVPQLWDAQLCGIIRICPVICALYSECIRWIRLCTRCMMELLSEQRTVLSENSHLFSNPEIWIANTITNKSAANGKGLGTSRIDLHIGAPRDIYGRDVDGCWKILQIPVTDVASQGPTFRMTPSHKLCDLNISS